MGKLPSKFALVIATLLLVSLASATTKAGTYTIVGEATDVTLATLTVISFTDGANGQFCFTVTNMSGVNGRVTGIGLDMSGVTGASVMSGTNLGGFTGTTDQNTIGFLPQFSNTTLDAAFLASTATSFSDGGSGGLANNQTSALFCFTGNFGSLTELEVAQMIYVRFLGINIGSSRQDVGRGAIPEPATIILLTTGLAGIAAKGRRRRRKG